MSTGNVTPSSHKLDTLNKPVDLTDASPPDRVNGLKIVDYRHARFVLDHNTGLFKLLRCVLVTLNLRPETYSGGCEFAR
jgi:hypothetical protein